MYMGDIGDIQVSPLPDYIQLIFHLQGIGPDECDFKFNKRVPPTDPTPCRFAGVMWLRSPTCYGTQEDCSCDLRQVAGKIKWEARVTKGKVYAEFVAGGIVFTLNRQTMAQDTVPYPDSMPRTSLGVKPLTEQWQSFTFPVKFQLTEPSFKGLTSENIPADILEILQSLKDKEFSDEEEFFNDLKKQMGEEQAAKYKTLLLKYGAIPHATVIRPEYFQHVVGAFGVVVPWSSNGVILKSNWRDLLAADWRERLKDGQPVSDQPLAQPSDPITIEIRNIRYER